MAVVRDGEDGERRSQKKSYHSFPLQSLVNLYISLAISWNCILKNIANLDVQVISKLSCSTHILSKYCLQWAAGFWISAELQTQELSSGDNDTGQKKLFLSCAVWWHCNMVKLKLGKWEWWTKPSLKGLILYNTDTVFWVSIEENHIFPFKERTSLCLQKRAGS